MDDQNNLFQCRADSLRVCACCGLPEALRENIWQQPRRPPGVGPALSTIWLSWTVLCSCPRLTEGPFHSLLVLGRTIPVHKNKKGTKWGTRHQISPHEFTLHIQTARCVIRKALLKNSKGSFACRQCQKKEGQLARCQIRTCFLPLTSIGQWEQRLQRLSQRTDLF